MDFGPPMRSEGVVGLKVSVKWNVNVRSDGEGWHVVTWRIQHSSVVLDQAFPSPEAGLRVLPCSENRGQLLKGLLSKQEATAYFWIHVDQLDLVEILGARSRPGRSVCVALSLVCS